MKPANPTDATRPLYPTGKWQTPFLLSAAILIFASAANAAPRPASDDQYRRATGTAPTTRPAARPAAAPARQYSQAPTSYNSAIAASIRSILPNQDKLAEYVRAAVRSAPGNTAAVVTEAVSAAPQHAETVVHAAIQTRPEQAETITAAALSIAPTEADRVTYAAIAANPPSAAASVRGALAAAPQMQPQIRDAAQLAAAKYRINDPALNQALAANYAQPQATLPEEDNRDLYYEEDDRNDYVAASSGLVHRSTLKPALHRQNGLPTPAGHSRER